MTIDGAKGILLNITGGSDLSLYEINHAASIIRETAHPDVNLIFGAVIDEKMQGEVRITVIATGFHGMPSSRKAVAAVERKIVATPQKSKVVAATAAPINNGDVGLDIPDFLRKRRGR